MKKFKIVFATILIMLLICEISFAQDNINNIDLSKVGDSNIWEVFNRKVSVSNENGDVVLNFNSQPGDGFASLKNMEFTNGTIEADIKGKDVQGNSFVGIAFRGVNDSTFDAVYFRPFNFLSDDSARKSHSVQYISQPVYTWSKLRAEHTGEYEYRIDNPPDPNSFFHAKIVIEKPKISVYVNDAEQPCLVVNELSERKAGWIGLWVGNYSDGAFANLKISEKK